MPALERAMRFRVARQGVLAANLANVDTPGYRRVDLEFDRALEGAGLRLAATHQRHLRAGPAMAATHSGHIRTERTGGDYRVKTGLPGTRPDRNGVELEREVVTLSRNAGAFTQQAAVLSRLHVMARIAATGEPR